MNLLGCEWSIYLLPYLCKAWQTCVDSRLLLPEIPSPSLIFYRLFFSPSLFCFKISWRVFLSIITAIHITYNENKKSHIAVEDVILAYILSLWVHLHVQRTENEPEQSAKSSVQMLQTNLNEIWLVQLITLCKIFLHKVWLNSSVQNWLVPAVWVDYLALNLLSAGITSLSFQI